MYKCPNDLLIELSPILQDRLDYENPDKLKEQLSILQSKRIDVLILIRNTYKVLLEKRERTRLPKGKEYTEFDRKTIQGASISQEEADYEMLLQINQIISERIELGMSFLQAL